jgi:hypothetical protein
MALASVTLEEAIHGRIATIERLPIMLFRDWFFVPGGNAHRRFRAGFDIAAMTARGLAFGAGGFSSRFSTKRLSRSDKTIRSDSSITAFGLPQGGLENKLRQVCVPQRRSAHERSLLLRSQPEVHSWVVVHSNSRHRFLLVYLLKAYMVLRGLSRPASGADEAARPQSSSVCKSPRPSQTPATYFTTLSKLSRQKILPQDTSSRRDSPDRDLRFTRH